LEKETKSLAGAPLEVQFMWALGILKSTTKIPKKRWKRAYWLRRQSKFEDEIVEKGKKVKKTFIYGFRRFFIKEEHKQREILSPHPDIQSVFDGIKSWLEKADSPHKNAFGFIKGRSHKKAVETLVGNRHYFGFDIANAFPSITLKMIEDTLQRLNVNESIIFPLAWFVTYYENQRILPQGSSCSPILLNLVYKPMCEEIQQICKKRRIKWAVYADDFTFGAKKISEKSKNELLEVPAKFGFKIKNKKIKDNRGQTIPRVLGLTIVEDKIHIKRGAKNKFRRIFYAAMMFNAYSSKQVQGTANAIKDIYGEEKNWPGWLLKPYLQYIKTKGGGKNGRSGSK